MCAASTLADRTVSYVEISDIYKLNNPVSNRCMSFSGADILGSRRVTRKDLWEMVFFE